MAKKDLDKTPRVTDNGEIDLSPERAFVVKRTGKQVARLQRRIKVTKWIVISLLLLVILLYLMFIFFWQGGGEGAGDDYGDFTVKIDEGQRNLISLCETEDFAEPTIFLRGTSVHDLWHCTRDWIPEDIQDQSAGGAHNSDDPSYLAYTFHLKNLSDEEIKYTYDCMLVDRLVNKQVDALDAIRIMIIRNGDKVVWAKDTINDVPIEPNTMLFTGSTELFATPDNVIAPGDTDKYTVVMWLEGEDPECINDIFNNMLKFEMNFEVQNKFKQIASETEEVK